MYLALAEWLQDFLLISSPFMGVGFVGVDHLCISIKPSAIRLSVLVITDYHVWFKCGGVSKVFLLRRVEGICNLSKWKKFILLIFFGDACSCVIYRTCGNFHCKIFLKVCVYQKHYIHFTRNIFTHESVTTFLVSNHHQTLLPEYLSKLFFISLLYICS